MATFHDISWFSVLKQGNYNSHITNLHLLFFNLVYVDFPDRQYTVANSDCFLPIWLFKLPFPLDYGKAL